MTIRCVVAGSNANGSPDFFFVMVRATEEQIANGKHYDVAREAAKENGYDGEMVAFDENDPPKFLFDHFVWETALVYAMLDTGELYEVKQ